MLGSETRVSSLRFRAKDIIYIKRWVGIHWNTYTPTHTDIHIYIYLHMHLYKGIDTKGHMGF